MKKPSRLTAVRIRMLNGTFRPRQAPRLILSVIAALACSAGAEGRLWAVPPDSGQEALIASPPEPLALSLEEAIVKALENDTRIRVGRLNPSIALNGIAVEKGEFDVNLNGSWESRFSLNPRPASLIEGFFLASETKSAQTDYALGFEQRLYTGTKYDLKWENSRSRSSFQSFNPSYQSSVGLTVTQPLLNGFGWAVNRGQILIARNNYDIAREAFLDLAMDLVQQVQDRYWELLLQRESHKVQQQSVQAALDLLEINQAKVQQGLLAPIEVLVAEAEVARRREDLLITAKALQDAEDRLIQLIGPADLLKEITIIPTDEPSQAPYSGEPRNAIQTALEERPDLKQARTGLDNRRISYGVARNRVLPSLELQAGLGLNGLGDTYGNDLDQVASGDFYTWRAALAISMPIGNRSARADAAIKRLEMERDRLDLKRLEQEAVLEVKEALRRVETDFSRIEATRKARFLSAKKLEVESERYNVGLATTQDVLEFQEDLADAQVKELKAILDYNRSLANLERAGGIGLKTFNIHLDGNDP